MLICVSFCCLPLIKYIYFRYAYYIFHPTCLIWRGPWPSTTPVIGVPQPQIRDSRSPGGSTSLAPLLSRSKRKSSLLPSAPLLTNAVPTKPLSDTQITWVTGPGLPLGIEPMDLSNKGPGNRVRLVVTRLLWPTLPLLSVTMGMKVLIARTG